MQFKSIPKLPTSSSLPHHLGTFDITLWNCCSFSFWDNLQIFILAKKSSLPDITSLHLVPLLPPGALGFAAQFPTQRWEALWWTWHPKLKQERDFDPPRTVNKSPSTDTVQASMPFSINNLCTPLCIIFSSEKPFVHGDKSCHFWGQWQASLWLQQWKDWLAVEQGTLEPNTMQLYIL